MNGWGLVGKRSAPELSSRCCPFSALPVPLLLPGCSRGLAGGYSGSRNGATRKAPTAGLWSCCSASEHELERIERLWLHLAATCSRSMGRGITGRCRAKIPCCSDWQALIRCYRCSGLVLQVQVDSNRPEAVTYYQQSQLWIPPPASISGLPPIFCPQIS